jgi:hypothetical protein
MKYLSGDILVKVFHALMSIIYLTYSSKSHGVVEKAIYFLPFLLAQKLLDMLSINNKPVVVSS